MNTMRALTDILPFRRQPAAGCGFLRAREIDALLDGRLAESRRAGFERHRCTGCAPCNLLAADAEVFLGVFDRGPLPGELRAFNDTQALVKAHLRQELQRREEQRSVASRFVSAWKPLVGVAAAAVLLTLVFLPRGGMSDGTVALPGGGRYAISAMPFSAPPQMRGADNLADLWRQAGEQYSGGDFDGAAKTLETIAVAKADSHEAALYRGAALVLAGRHAEAVEPLRRAVELGQALGLRLAADHYYLGVAALGLDDTASAAAELQAARDAGGEYGELADELLTRLQTD